jgi:hypothetical protein
LISSSIEASEDRMIEAKECLRSRERENLTARCGGTSKEKMLKVV